MCIQTSDSPHTSVTSDVSTGFGTTASVDPLSRITPPLFEAIPKLAAVTSVSAVVPTTIAFSVTKY